MTLDMTDNANILIVDDDRELGDMLKEFLAPDHFNVTTCLSGEDGLKTLRENDFNLVILDIMLPGISGIDVLREVRQSNDVPIIMLTARGDDVDRILGLEFGAVGLCFAAASGTLPTLTLVFTVVATPLFFFSGSFFPIEVLPGWLQPVAWAAPLTPGVHVARGFAEGSLDASFLIPAAYLLTLSVAFYPLAVVLLRRRLVK